MATTTTSNEDVIPIAITLDCDEKGLISIEDREAFFKILRNEKPDNKLCFDCASRNAPWMSATFSIFLCVNCSGSHRSLGSKVSFVRSCNLDMIRVDEALRMELGGNGRARSFFRAHGYGQDGKVVDYRSKVAEKYRKMLDKEVHLTLEKHRPDLLSPSPSASASSESDVDDTSLPSNSKKLASSEGQPQKQPTLIVHSKPELLTMDDTAIKTSSPGKKNQIGRADDFDFDFDTAFERGAANDKPNPAATKRNRELFLGTPPVAHEYHDAVEEEQPQSSSRRALPVRDLTNAKSISAQDFQAASNDDNLDVNFAKFKDAEAISSDAFFNNGNGMATTEWIDDDLGTRMALIREEAIQRTVRVAALAQDTVRNAAKWFSKVTQQ